MQPAPRQTCLVIALAAAAVLAGAWGFQFAGYDPCPLCLMQRWPWYAAVPLGLVFWGLATNPKATAAGLVLLGLIMAASAVFGAYHAGIEWKFWPGPGSCSGELGGGLPGLTDEPVISCDAAAWRYFGISLAGYNALLSAALSALALTGLRARP